MALHELTATQLAQRLAAGDTTAEAICRACLERVAARTDIAAWTHVAADAALAAARAVDAMDPADRGPLAGIPIAVKDIIATVDMPTAYGSPIYAGHRPPWDAACVALVREAGGIPLGKTVTTEFAYFHPGPTVNPHNPAHTPGGSSSGSAAAIADFHVPLAFGSPTAGSVLRPASYCGIVGFKPTYGRFSLAGVKPLAHSLDTLGWFARGVDDIALLRSVLMREPHPLPEPEGNPRVAVYPSLLWSNAEPSAQAALTETAARLAAAGAEVSDLELPDEFEFLDVSQRTYMNYEAARDLSYERTAHLDDLSTALRRQIDLGLDTSAADYHRAIAHARSCRAAFAAAVEGFDIVLTPAAPGEAPAGLGTTGDPVFNRIWTALGVPAINLPAATGPTGLPVGVQMITPFGRDADLLVWARWAEAALA